MKELHVPAAEPVAAIAWFGYVQGTEEGAQYDNCLILMPEGTGGVGLAGTEEGLEAEIVALRHAG